MSDPAANPTSVSLRPHGRAYLDLVEKPWRTDAKGATDRTGTFRTRGFYGDYDLTVKGKTAKAPLAEGGWAARVRREGVGQRKGREPGMSGEKLAGRARARGKGFGKIG